MSMTSSHQVEAAIIRALEMTPREATPGVNTTWPEPAG